MTLPRSVITCTTVVLTVCLIVLLFALRGFHDDPKPPRLPRPTLHMHRRDAVLIYEPEGDGTDQVVSLWHACAFARLMGRKLVMAPLWTGKNWQDMVLYFDLKELAKSAGVALIRPGEIGSVLSEHIAASVTIPSRVMDDISPVGRVHSILEQYNVTVASSTQLVPECVTSEYKLHQCLAEYVDLPLLLIPRTAGRYPIFTHAAYRRRVQQPMSYAPWVRQIVRSVERIKKITTWISVNIVTNGAALDMETIEQGIKRVINENGQTALYVTSDVPDIVRILSPLFPSVQIVSLSSGDREDLRITEAEMHLVSASMGDMAVAFIGTRGDPLTTWIHGSRLIRDPGGLPSYYFGEKWIDRFLEDT